MSLIRRGFTLIELLVVIAIIALLISLLLPSFTAAKTTAKSLKEQGVAHQMVTASVAYQSDSKDMILPGGCHWSWNHAPANRYSLLPSDPWNPRRRLMGSITKIWVMHFVSWNSFPLESVQLDKATYLNFLSRPVYGYFSSDMNYSTYLMDESLSAFAWHPSLGMNTVYYGGNYSFGAFRGQGPSIDNQDSDLYSPYGNPTPAGNPKISGGQFYVRQGADVRYPSTMLEFASSRGGDVATGAGWSYGEAIPNSCVIRPGYYTVLPPTMSPYHRGGFRQAYTLANRWYPSNNFNPSAVAGTWGMMDMRYHNKAVTAMVDGHVEMQSLEQLRDMRKWANMADRADWTFPTSASQITW